MYQHIDIPQPKWDKRNRKWILSIMIEGKRKQFVSRTSGMPGKRDCRDRAREWIENGCNDNGEMRLNVVWERFVEDYKRKKGNNSQLINLNSFARSYILPALGTRKCKSLKLEDWQSVINDAKPLPRYCKDGTAYYRAEKLSRKYLLNLKGAMTCFIKWAEVRKYLPSTPTDQLYVPSDSTVKGKGILQLSDIEKLFKEPTGLWYERALLFDVLTGLRPGELIGLQRDDYDPRSGILMVRRAINARGDVTGGKNSNAKRIIELPEAARTILEEQLLDTEYLDSEWIFCNNIGCPARQEAVRRCWRRIVRIKDLPEDVTPYSLRHTFFSHTEAYLPDSHRLYGKHIISEEAHEAAERLSVTPIYKAASKSEANAE